MSTVSTFFAYSCDYLFLHCIYKLEVFIVYSFTLMSPCGKQIITQTVVEFMYMDNLWLHIGCVHMLVYVDDYFIYR